MKTPLVVFLQRTESSGAAEKDPRNREKGLTYNEEEKTYLMKALGGGFGGRRAGMRRKLTQQMSDTVVWGRK